MSSKINGYRIYGVSASKLYNKTVRVYTRGHVTHVIYGKVVEVTESSLVLESGTKYIVPISQIKMIEVIEE